LAWLREYILLSAAIVVCGAGVHSAAARREVEGPVCLSRSSSTHIRLAEVSMMNSGCFVNI
jgi:hypothetical protein